MFDDPLSDPDDFLLPVSWRVIGGRLNRLYHFAQGQSHCVDETGARIEFRDEHRAHEHLSRAVRRAIANGAPQIDIRVSRAQ